VYLLAVTFPTYEQARAARRSAMGQFSLASFDAQLDTGHGDAMVVFRVPPVDVTALRDVIAHGAGSIVYEHTVGAHLVA
jgi:hypothetical protein